MNTEDSSTNSINEKAIQSIVDGEMDFISAMNLVGEAVFTVDQWRKLTLGLMEDRLMRSAAVQFRQGEIDGDVVEGDAAGWNEPCGVKPNRAERWDKREKQPVRANRRWSARRLLAVAASILITMFSFGAGMMLSSEWAAPWQLDRVAEVSDDRGTSGAVDLLPNGSHSTTADLGMGKKDKQEGLTSPIAQKSGPVHTVSYPVDIEQLQEKGKFDRSDIDDAFITRAQRKQLMQSGFMVDELVGTTVLTVSPRVKQPVATRIICVRYVGDLSVQ